MPTDIYIDLNRLENYGETCSKLAAPNGKISPKRMISSIKRDTAYIIKAAASVERFLASPSRPPHGFVPKELEWLTDNASAIEKESKVLLQELKGAPHLPAVKCGNSMPSALRLAEDFLRSGQYEFSKERLEVFLNGANKYRKLRESELWLFVPLLKIAALSAVKTESYRIMKELSGYLFGKDNDIFYAEAELWQLLTNGRTPKNLTRNLASEAQSVHDGITTRLSNAIKSLKTLSSEDLTELLCRASAINLALMRDPSGVYQRMTAESQSYCRLKSEIAARHAHISEEDFANELVRNAEQDTEKRGVCGQIDDLVYFKKRKKKLSLLYILVDTAFPIILSSAIAAAYSSTWLFLLLILPVWELSRSIVNYIFLSNVRPDMLYMLDLKDGVPKEGMTLVAIAILIISKEQALSYIRKLKRYQIANRDAGKNVIYALLADFPDSKTKERENENEITEAIRSELETLNKNSENSFCIVSRPRIENAADGIFMGRERKRGAVLSLLSLIKDGNSESVCYGASSEIIRKVRYIICLDSDTELVPSSVKKMVGAALHPQNKPVINHDLGRVVSGYGILQPKIAVSLDDANASEFARIYSGQGGTDPYSSVCGEIYQDIFSDSVFIGKGIIDAGAMSTCLENAIPDNRVLSHDLLEGGYLRVGFLSSVELPDGFPAKVSSYFKRTARWIRGDVQLMPWLFSEVRNRFGKKIRNPLTELTKFKIRDNIRRALTPFAVLLCFTACLLYPSFSTYCAALVALLSMSAPMITNSVNRLRRLGENLTTRYRATIYAGFLGGLLLLFSRFLMLPYEAYVTQRSIITSMYRMFISKRKLLEWVTAAQAESGGGGIASYFSAMWPQTVFAAATAVIGLNMLSIYTAVLWVAAPLYAALISRRQYFVDELSSADRAYLLEKAGLIWSWFDNNLTSADSFLIPDNTQEYPEIKLARRTSPTNIGFSMLAVVSACELGFVTPEEAEEKLSLILASVEGLEKYHGHLYNWYSTKTCTVLRPATVSSVDSGNFIAALYVVSTFLKKLDTPRSRSLARKADMLIKNADFSLFCDQSRLLLRVSINTETGEAADSFYDMMASEARLTSFIAIAKGDVPKKHWEKLSRALVRTGIYSCMLSWSGSLFEYLMPDLLMTEHKNSLIYESNRCAVWAHMKSAARKGVPWGISESCYYDFDRALNYCYSAHGIPELGCKRGLENDLVVSSYSSYLALLCSSSAVVKNLRLLDALGVSGSYGHYEAIDFTENRGSKKEGKIIESYMAHHMGMSLCATANVLTVDREGKGSLQRYFSTSDEIAAFDTLIKERIPLSAPVSDNRNSIIKERRKKEEGEEFEKKYRDWDRSAPPCALLSKGDMSIIVSAEGKMVSKWREYTLYRSEKGGKEILKGLLVALKTNSVNKSEKNEIIWSEFDIKRDNCSLISEKGELKITQKIAISDENSAEIHDITLENMGIFATNCDLCVYFEPVLGKMEDYLSHPEYYRLFISGENAENGAVITRKDPKTGKKIFLFALSNVKGSISTSRSDIIGRWDYINSEPLFQKIKPQNGATIKDAAVRFLHDITVDSNSSTTIRIVLAIGEDRRRTHACALRALALQRFSPSDALAEPPISDEALETMSRLIYPKLRNLPDIFEQSTLMTGLWELGISGDMPIVLFDARRETDDFLVSEIYKAVKIQDILEKNGFKYDLVFICDEKGEYKRPVYNICLFAQNTIKGACISSKAHIYITDLANLSDYQFTALKGATSLFLPFFPDKIDEKKPYDEIPETFYEPVRLPAVVHSQPLAVENFGCLTCDVGITHSWYKNARLLRLTPWENDPLAAAFDGESFIIFLKDKSISAFMAHDGTRAKIEFGQGSTVWYKETEGLKIRTECFIAGSPPVRLVTIEITGFQDGCVPEIEWLLLPVMGEKNSDNFFTFSVLKEKSIAVKNPYNLMYKDVTMWLKTYPDFCEYACGRAQKIAIKVKPEVKAGSAFTIFALSTENSAEKFLSRSAAEKARAEAKKNRIKEVKNIEIKTPNDALDRYINNWSAWQVKGSRIFSRSSFYQNGGGYGFRDQIQDASAFLITEPKLLREQIIRCCSHQYEEGDVQHWWHTVSNGDTVKYIGVRTMCSDDYLWLVWAVCEYICVTGDLTLMTEEAPYLTSKPLENGEQERYEWLNSGDIKDSVLGHCIRALDLFIKRGIGSHGLPFVLGGDWNDSMNRMGEKGRGESVWLAWFGAIVLKRFSEILEDIEKRNKYAEYSSRLTAAAENVYNGNWYPRGFDDSGIPVGSPENDECRIDSLSQSFAVFAGADAERSRRALENALKYLVDRETRVVKLFSPPFEKRESMGYISSYPPGVRENGGQYTHAAIWLASACLKMGMTGWGYSLLDMLLPEYRDEGQYRAEPFVLAADVYSEAPLAGQAGWSWYTGAAGWYRRTVINDLLGITVCGGKLFIKPNVPKDWQGFECVIRYGSAVYRITAKRETETHEEISEGIPLFNDGKTHDITVSI